MQSCVNPRVRIVLPTFPSFKSSPCHPCVGKLGVIGTHSASYMEIMACLTVQSIVAGQIIPSTREWKAGCFSCADLANVGFSQISLIRKKNLEKVEERMKCFLNMEKSLRLQAKNKMQRYSQYSLIQSGSIYLWPRILCIGQDRKEVIWVRNENVIVRGVRLML